MRPVPAVRGLRPGSCDSAPEPSTREPAVKDQRSLLRTALYLAVLLLPGCVVFTCRVP